MKISKFATTMITLLALICLGLGFIVGREITYPAAYNEGANVGYNSALMDVAALLQQEGITLDWHRGFDGSYVLTVTTQGGQIARATVRANLLIEWRDKYGHLKETGRGAGSMTSLGLNWTINQISGLNLLGYNSVAMGSAPNASTMALYLADALAPTSGPNATSTILDFEYTTGGMERAVATSKNIINVTSPEGWNCTVVKTASASVTPAIWGLCYTPYADATTTGHSLIAYDSGPGSKSMSSGDTLTETWTIAIS